MWCKSPCGGMATRYVTESLFIKVLYLIFFHVIFPQAPDYHKVIATILTERTCPFLKVYLSVITTLDMLFSVNV